MQDRYDNKGNKIYSAGPASAFEDTFKTCLLTALATLECGGKLTDPFQYSRIDLPLHRLVVNGVLVLALMVKRDEWPKIRADIGSSLVLGAAPPPKKPAFDLDALCDAARARIAAQIDESATKHMRAIRLQNRAVEGLALMTFKRISLEFRAETGQL